MDEYPLQAVLFGLANRCFEPFCCGCAGFLISYRYSKAFWRKIVAIAITAAGFLWMDDLWPAIAMREAQMGIASNNEKMAEALRDNRQLGVAEYSTGERSGLWDVFRLESWDVGSAIVFVPLAFWVGLVSTGRRWSESQCDASQPPPPPYSRCPPPPPTNI